MSKQVLQWKSMIRFSVLVAVSVGLIGCAAYESAMENEKASYKRAEKRSTSLEVPPDLTVQNSDDYFDLSSESEAATSSSAPVTASGYFTGQSEGKVSPSDIQSAQPVLTKSAEVQIRNAGPVRSLVIQKPAAVVFVELRKYWQELGFDLVIDNPRIGLLETNWLENRAAIPLDGLRKYIGRVFDGVYSSNMRDKYRIRIEPIDSNSTEVFITHRGMEEVYADNSQSHLVWRSRPSDPELEAEMTNRFVAHLVGDDAAQQVAGQAESKSQVAEIDSSGDVSRILMPQSFPEAWRVVGFALDRAGFIVEDRDRTNGLYYVRYSPDSSMTEKKSSGFIGKIFDFRSDKKLQPDQKLQVSVIELSSNQSEVQFLDERGEALSQEFSKNASNLLIAKFPR